MFARRRWIFAAVMLVLIFIRPQEAVSGAQRAMRMWYQGVAPAMLPFLALMPMITSKEACTAYRKIFSAPMRFFHLPGAAAPVIIAAMVSGSPGGAAIIYEMKEGGGISDSDAARIALAVSGVSPAWLVLGVGCGMLGSKSAGLKIAAVQAAVQLFLLKSLEKVKIAPSRKSTYIQHPSSGGAMWSAAQTVITVCGYMAVFGAYGNVLASFIGEKAGIALMSMLDLPSGAGLLAAKQFPGRMAAVGASVGFGGICIAAQNMERIRNFGIRWRDYLAVRISSAAICGASYLLIFEKKPLASNISSGKGKIYVISLLTAGIFALPGMIFLSKNIFLNKGKGGKMNGEICQNPN